jgi:PilZ domain
MAVLSPEKITENEQIAWQLVEKLDEQRRYPRIRLDIAVAFRNGSGQHCAAKLLNIAPDGIQIRCNVATAQILHPGGGKICPNNAPLVQCAIAMPLANGPDTLSVCARLTYLTTVPDEPRCVIGLQFLDPRPKAQRIIDRFFADKLLEYFDVDNNSAVYATA